MDENGHFLIIANEADYNRDSYDDSVISKHSKLNKIILSSHSRQIQEFEFEE